MSAKNWTLLAAILGSGVVFLDSQILPLALDAIGNEPRLFLARFEAQNYIHWGYLLTLSALLVLAGAMTDTHGRRRMFQLGLIGFGLTSLLCALAPNLEALVLFRLLQGAAGAMTVPGSLALITNTFAGEAQGRAFGIWAAATSASLLLGPFVGGLLVQELSWRAIFLINLPLLALALWALLRGVPDGSDQRASGHLDWVGALLIALAVGGLSFGVIYGQQRNWEDSVAFAVLAVGAVATLVLPAWFAHARHPLVPLGMFRSRNFSVTNLSTLLIYGAIYVTFFLLPIFLQGTLGYTATAAGIALVPTAIFLVMLSARFGSLASRYGPRRFMAAGPVLMAAGLAWLSRVPAESSAWRLSAADPASFLPSAGYLTDFLPGLVVYGIGVAVMVAPLTTALMRSVPGRQAGLASAINNAISRVGPQLAGALVFVIVTASFYSVLAARVPGLDVASPEVRAALPPLAQPAVEVPPGQLTAARQASTEAFGIAMLVAAAMALAGGLVNGIGISDRQARAGHEQASEDGPPPAARSS